MNKNKGKLNFLDIFIMLLLIVILIFSISKFKKPNKQLDNSQSNKILITYFVEQIPDYVAFSIKENDPVTERIQSANFGVVKNIKINDSISWNKDDNDNLVKSNKEGYKSIIVTMEMNGTTTDNGISIDKSNYHVGQTISLYIGNSYIETGRISDVKSLEM